MKLIASLTYTMLFIVVLLVTYVIHARYFPVDVILYAAILDAVIAVAITAVALCGFDSALGGFEKLLIVVVWMLGGYAFAISVPTVIDRSLSFYILEKLQQRGGGIKEAAIPEVFVDEYMPEYRLVDVRLTEQLASGTITIRGGCVQLTDFGERVATISGFMRRNFLAKNRQLAGQYTDVLTMPFDKVERSQQGYECGDPVP